MVTAQSCACEALRVLIRKLDGHKTAALPADVAPEYDLVVPFDPEAFLTVTQAAASLAEQVAQVGVRLFRKHDIGALAGGHVAVVADDVTGISVRAVVIYNAEKDAVVAWLGVEGSIPEAA